jgi:hypothetical protein
MELRPQADEDVEMSGLESSLAILLAVLKIIFIFVSWPPLLRGVPGDGPDCHVPTEIVGVGPIPARIRGFFVLILAARSSLPRLLNALGGNLDSPPFSSCLGGSFFPGRATTGQHLTLVQ